MASQENEERVVETKENKEIERLKKLTFEKVDKDKSKEAEKNVFKHAMKLVRCIVTCNNKNKTSYTGEVFCASNKNLPDVKKFIQFNVPTHVPQILLNVIQEKEYQLFKEKKLPNGNSTKSSYLVPEYNVQILPPLTAEEFDAIKRKQLAEGERD